MVAWNGGEVIDRLAAQESIAGLIGRTFTGPVKGIKFAVERLNDSLSSLIRGSLGSIGILLEF